MCLLHVDRGGAQETCRLACHCWLSLARLGVCPPLGRSGIYSCPLPLCLPCLPCLPAPQTLVFKLGLAKSIHHARVLIRQRHIRVGKQIVNIPSFMVRVDSQVRTRMGLLGWDEGMSERVLF